VKRVNIEMPDDIHTRAKVIAVLRGMTLNDYLAAAVTEAVEKDKSVLQHLQRK
jgi:predicted HicB family RNase H-like nuclease